jgi:DNA-binding transcriptional ArsR family regulator
VESDTVWRALASPHRRKLLDLLKDGPQTTGQLSKELPDLSRFAVMQHLGVPEEAELVLVRREGRSRFNYLNPVPIRQLYERWMRNHSSIAAETALHLKRYAESTKEVDQKMDQGQYRLVEIEMEMQIAAPRERVFAALTAELGNWWPHRYKDGSDVYCDPVIGGRIGERFKDGGGAVYGEIVYLDAPAKLACTGPSALQKGLSSFTTDTLEEVDGGTLLKRSFQIWGSVPNEIEDMYRKGTRQIMEDALKSYCERGIGFMVEAGQ